MTARRALPNRRRSEVITFGHGGHEFVGSVSRFADGRLAEVFLDTGKISSGLGDAARDAAVLCSIALQHGAPPETLRRALARSHDGSAEGPLGALLDIVEADAPADV